MDERGRIHDPAAPKRPASAFLRFASKARREGLDAATAALPPAELQRALSERWKGMNDAARAEFVQANVADRLRYACEKAAYVAPRGDERPEWRARLAALRAEKEATLAEGAAKRKEVVAARKRKRAELRSAKDAAAAAAKQRKAAVKKSVLEFRVRWISRWRELTNAHKQLPTPKEPVEAFNVFECVPSGRCPRRGVARSHTRMRSRAHTRMRRA
jgi:hypothetical protein